MDYEIKFLPVGDNSKSGDAILLRFGKLNNKSEQCVIVIDGGTAETGKEIVEKIKKTFSTNSVDLVISTHPDADHSSGLNHVLENLNVYKLWIHRPWEYSSQIRELFNNGKITSSGLNEYIKNSLESVCDLVDLAKRKGIKIEEPFSDTTNVFEGCIEVVGPSSHYYKSLLPGFRSTPGDPQLPTYFKTKSLFEKGIDALENALSPITLKDPEVDATSAENNSSVVTLVKLNEELFLFTGDAGVPSLTQAIDVIEKKGHDLKKLSLIQVPHHGSKRNLGPTLLDRIIEPVFFEDKKVKIKAIISAAKNGSPKHPSLRVTNALIKKGCEVHVTQGEGLRFTNNGGPFRDNGVKSSPISFCENIPED
jgi:beta-lactamase superfamily II metal-dependent hydrolase